MMKSKRQQIKETRLHQVFSTLSTTSACARSQSIGPPLRGSPTAARPSLLRGCLRGRRASTQVLVRDQGPGPCPREPGLEEPSGKDAAVAVAVRPGLGKPDQEMERNCNTDMSFSLNKTHVICIILLWKCTRLSEMDTVVNGVRDGADGELPCSARYNDAVALGRTLKRSWHD